LKAVLATADFATDATLELAVQGLATQHGLKATDYFPATRLAVSGLGSGLDFYGMLRVLGRERVLSRIERLLAS
jgi:glutamyl/glutaminyl-tRNA synthetase